MSPTGVGGRSAWLVLDVDDTLVDTRHTGLAKVRGVAAELGLPQLGQEAFDAVYGTRAFRASVATWYPGADVDAFCDRYDRWATVIPPRPLCDGARVVAHARAAGMGVGVLTNGPGRKTAMKLAAVGLSASMLDFVCHADNWPVAKPHSDAFARLAAFGLDPGRTWYVSDAAADCLGSRTAGLRSVGVATSGIASRSAAPDLVLSRPALLEAMVAALPDLPSRTWAGPPRAVSFDAGFTLVRDRTDAADLVAGFLASRGIDVPRVAVRAALGEERDVLADHAGWSSDSSISRMLCAFYSTVLRRFGAVDANDGAVAIVERYTQPENWEALPAARAALELVREQSLPTGVLSNWQSTLDVTLASAGLRDLVDAVVSSTAVGVAKPEPAAFAAMANALGVPVGALVHVGDDPDADAAGMLRAGGRAVLVDQQASGHERVTAVGMALPGAAC